MLNRSRVVFTSSLSELSTGIPTVMAYGDQDDHLRLTVLLAHSLGQDCDQTNVKRCLDRRTPWPQRKKALRDVIEEKQRRSKGTIVRFVDPDALDVDPDAPEPELEAFSGDGSTTQSRRWEDASFRRERSDLFRMLVDRFDNDGWELVRTEPRSSTTNKLVAVDLEPVELGTPKSAFTMDEQRLENVLSARVSPVLQPLIRAMVSMEKLRTRTAARMLEASSKPTADDLVFEMAYDTLSVMAIEAGKRLALLRGPQALNGVAGAFRLNQGQDDEWLNQLAAVPRAAVLELEEAAWLNTWTEVDGSRRFSMMNAMRSFFAERATFAQPDLVHREHTWLAEQKPDDVNGKLEVHHHAIATGDYAQALATAHYYGADLRKIAFELSARHKNYRESANVYRTIVDEFDERDAYAWEYFAYNLAYSYEGMHPNAIPSNDADRIRDGYIKASKYDPDNPLYKGRELAFRVRRGERSAPIHWEFEQALHRFRTSSGDDGVSYLARPVLQALRSERYVVADAPWASILRHNPACSEFFS